MRIMENLIPAPTPAKIETPGSSPVKKDVGRTGSSDDNAFNETLNKAKDKVEQHNHSNSNSDSSQTRNSDSNTTSENQQVTTNNSNEAVQNQQPAINTPKISDIISTEAKNLTLQQTKSSDSGLQTVPQNSNNQPLTNQSPSQQIVQNALNNTDSNLKTEGTVANNQKQETIITQLQKIIEASDVAPEKVSIKGSQQIVTSTNLGGTSQKADLASNQQNITPSKTDIASQRMEAGDSILAGKMSEKGVTNISNNKSDQQHLAGFDSPKQNTPQQTFAANLNSSPELLSPLTQTLLATADTQASPTTVINTQTSVVMPQSGMIYDDQVLQQIQQQFRIQSNKVQQKIKMQLHPAELGELKIDLTVKEGAIRVNVVAQTRQAQEVLERNISKLKNILEEQGLTIDDISIAQAADTSRDFNLFDGQFNGHSNFAQQDNNKNQTDLHSFKEQFNEIEGEQEDFTQSVNVSDQSGISITI